MVESNIQSLEVEIMGKMIIRLTIVIGTVLVLEGCCFNGLTQGISQPITEIADGSIDNFLDSVISVPCGEVNAVYYAGSIDDKSILMHETSTGMHKWILSEANIERDVIMPYTADKSKWLLLKGTTNQCFRHWNWKNEIEAKIQNLTKNSALVKPLSTFYRVDGNLNGSHAWVVRVDEFLVKATLCDLLKNGDKICTEQLYDGSNEEKQSIISKARLNMNPIVGRKPRDGGLCLASWDCGKFIQPEELPTETFFIIDNEIVAPFEFMWYGCYGGLLEFDEKIAQKAYVRRVDAQKREKHEQE